jgi:hypothetical protein
MSGSGRSEGARSGRGVVVIDVNLALESLAVERPVFHSETDFQLALGVVLQRMYPGARIRMEYRPFASERLYLDMWVGDGDDRTAIELKYKTRTARVNCGDEVYDFLGQGAQDLGCYDLWKDVKRVERVCRELDGVTGYVVFITNDSSYWRRSGATGTIAEAFRLHEGRKASGRLAWASHAGAGTTRNREHAIVLGGEYEIAWRDYSSLGHGPGETFRFTVVPITRTPAPSRAEEGAPAAPSVPIATAASPRRSKYAVFGEYLAAYREPRADLTYARIEAVLGFKLPPTFSVYRPAWANAARGGTPLMRAVREAGWRVDSVSRGERVIFTRVSEP